VSEAPVVDLGEVRQAEERRKQLADLDAQLLKSDKNAVLGTVSNLSLIIAQDPTLAGLCGFNEFTHQAVLHDSPPPLMDAAPPIPGPYPRPWQPADVAHIQSYLQRCWTRLAKRDDTEQAMNAVAATRRFHPVRDWLATLKWDGMARLDDWLANAFGAAGNGYTDAVAAKMLIAAVRRVRHPGCKFDHMPILEGAQGIGKSKALAALFGADWIADSLPPQLDGRDAALGLVGIWAIELAEIEQIIRAEVEVIKAFLSRPVDRFRAPYGKGFLTYPRQCILIGTTNSADYLRDDTGNRRFWPVACQFANVEWVTENREQLWAEAAIREARGEDHWLSDAATAHDAEVVQTERQQEDVWEDRVGGFLEGKVETTAADVLSICLMVPVERQGKREQMRVGGILKRAGWRRTLVRKGVVVSRVWLKR
jgi:putative DNA primase/helicase